MNVPPRLNLRPVVKALRNPLSLLSACLTCAVVFTLLPYAPHAFAQTPNLVTRAVDTGQLQPLANHHPLWATPANSLGAVPAGKALEGLTLVLARSAQQQQAFAQFLADQQNPDSPNYHHWLTPEEVGQRFGLSDADLAAVTAWLQSQGLHVNWVAPSRMFVGFGGAASAIDSAFHTELHLYSVRGEQRISVNSDPMIPAALAPAIRAVRGLYSINEQPQHSMTVQQAAAPQLTSSSSGNHYLAPADFNTIYNVPVSYTGAGQTIGIVGWSRIYTADLDNFRQKTGSTFPNPTQVVPTSFGGIDPGSAYTSPPSCTNDCTGGQSEATLDVERSGSTAPGANLLLVVSSSSGSNDGIGADAQYLVQTSPVPAQIMTISFGACESGAGPSGVSYWNTLFQQAASEGISVFVSSGDSGASGCDTSFTTPPTNPQPNSPNYICSSQYATCVGGTQFNDTANTSTYWNSSNGTGLASARSYIPEGAWNESWNGSTSTVAASGGGVSTVIATPAWQTGTGVPSARSGRYTPDVSFAAAGHDGYFGCFAAGGASCVTSSSSFSFTDFSGTSAAAPGMAGIAALLNQKLGSAQGNLNPGIYATAQNAPSAFHDTTLATSGLSSCILSTPSMCNNSIPGPSGLSGGQAGYAIGAGYDEVTGLGSLDVQAFLTSYANKITPAVTVTPASSSITTAQSLSVTIMVSGSPTPTGTITLTSGSYASAATTLSSGSATIIIPAGSLATGTVTLTATYTPDSTSSATYNTASGSNTVTVTTASPQPPAPLTGGATAITSTTATLNGSSFTGGADTHVWFLYGTSATLSGATQTPSQDIGSGSTSVLFSASLTGLTAGTTYYFRAVAQNSAATVSGTIQSFTTATAAPATFTVTGTNVTVTRGAATSNTSTITVTPSGGFTGSVSLSAQIISSPAGAQYAPTLSFGSTSPVSITDANAKAATLTITTTAASAALALPTRPGSPWLPASGAALAGLLLLFLPTRRHIRRGLLCIFALLGIFACLTACGGGSGSSGTGGGGSIAGTTTGAYTITITGASGATTATSNITLTVQ